MDQLALLFSCFTHTSCKDTRIALEALSIGWLDCNELLECNSCERVFVETGVLTLDRCTALVLIHTVSAEVKLALLAVP